MKYTVQVEGRALVIELDGNQVRVDGRPALVRLGGKAGEAYRRLVRERASRPFQAVPGEGRGAWVLRADGMRLAARVLDPLDLAIQAGRKGATGRGGGTLKAPMPGLVVRVLVKEGEQVDAGQGMVVVEAMKMENELKAIGPGIVRAVHVAPGARVEKGVPLVDLG